MVFEEKSGVKVYLIIRAPSYTQTLTFWSNQECGGVKVGEVLQTS
jgi:hypothetical protein